MREILINKGLATAPADSRGEIGYITQERSAARRRETVLGTFFISLLESRMTKRSWFRKFYDAGRGCLFGMQGQSSFAVHFLIAIAVIALAAWLRVERWEWIALLLCITAVLCAELFNSAIEYLAKGITREHDENIGHALDIASGAVLIAALGSAVIGLLILGPRLWELL